MKKTAIYPYDISNLHLLLYKEHLKFKSDDVFICITPRGWGYEQEDAGYKVGLHTGISVNSDFEKSIQDIDILLVADSILPIQNNDIVSKIEIALHKNIQVIVLRQLDWGLEEQLKKRAKECKNLYICSGNSMELSCDAEKEELSMEEIPAPIILVVGAGERCCKFDVQLELRKALLGNGYTVSQIGSKQYCEFLGFHSFPRFMLNDSKYMESEKIIAFNKYVQLLYRQENPDVIIIGVPGGVFPFDREFHNNFGITNYLVSNAVSPDYVIFNSLYIDMIPKYIRDMEEQIQNRYGYEIDEIFVSNFALDYSTSKSDKELKYITCSTSSIKKKTQGLHTFNIYDDGDKKEFADILINTLQDYSNLAII